MAEELIVDGGKGMFGIRETVKEVRRVRETLNEFLIARLQDPQIAIATSLDDGEVELETPAGKVVSHTTYELVGQTAQVRVSFYVPARPDLSLPARKVSTVRLREMHAAFTGDSQTTREWAESTKHNEAWPASEALRLALEILAGQLQVPT